MCASFLNFKMKAKTRTTEFHLIQLFLSSELHVKKKSTQTRTQKEKKNRFLSITKGKYYFRQFIFLGSSLNDKWFLHYHFHQTNVIFLAGCVFFFSWSPQKVPINWHSEWMCEQWTGNLFDSSVFQNENSDREQGKRRKWFHKCFQQFCSVRTVSFVVAHYKIQSSLAFSNHHVYNVRCPFMSTLSIEHAMIFKLRPIHISIPG